MKHVLFGFLSWIVATTAICETMIHSGEASLGTSATPYLTFSSATPFSLRTIQRWDGIVEYSTNATDWIEWDASEIHAGIQGTDYAIYLRGSTNSYFSTTYSDGTFVFTGSDIACHGNIENLLDYATVAAGEHPPMNTRCFKKLFSGATALTRAPELGATNLVGACYDNMFKGCTSLTTAPALPAMVLDSDCYNFMFNGCTALTAAPELPATNLTNYCYYRMFIGCSSLTTAPALPATTLTMHCYAGMFSGCTALTTAPALPATNLVESCYESMFEGCTSLTTAPALPATTLAVSCYQTMFSGCTALTAPPVLPATTMVKDCYYGLLKDCTALSVTPELPALNLAPDCYNSLFSGCTALTTSPELPATELATRCYMSLFEGCTALTVAPMLPATTMVDSCYYTMFSGCTSLKNAPVLPAMTLAQYCYLQMFKDCTTLTSLPALRATELKSSCYSGMFEGCTGIEVSDAPTAEYAQPWRIPTTGTATAESGTPNYNMLSGTGGPFTGTPDINTLYYQKAQLAPEGTYLTFSSTNSFTLAAAATGASKKWNGTLEYSTDRTLWHAWDGTVISAATTNGTDHALYLRGTGNSVISGDNHGRFILTGTDIACTGNIENLLDYATVAAGNHPTMGDNCFDSLFNSCAALTVAPALPATDLAGHCYYGMFGDCTALTAAPALPATNLVERCYSRMFSGCTALTVAPALPATILAENCYSVMFFRCTALTAVPALPATNLASWCYNAMFEGCTALTVAPALPATNLVSWCYSSMFQSCTALTDAPALPATDLVGGCYDSMFSGCTALTVAPALSATDLEGYCYNAMFSDCTALTAAPALPATDLAHRCYSHMFEGCTALTVAPALPATTLDMECYYEMFRNSGIAISDTEDDEYTLPWSIPASATSADDWNADMFSGTAGSFTGNPEIGYVYYQRTHAAKPVMTPAAGEYVDHVTVSISAAEGASIYYTTDGTDPTTNSAPYTAALTLDTVGTTTTVKAIAVKDGLENSVVASAVYTVLTIAEPGTYLTFSSTNSFTLAVGSTGTWNGTLEYSTDRMHWHAWDGTDITANVDDSTDYVLYLRGTGNTVISGDLFGHFILTGADIACTGNIENLLDYATVAAGNHPTMGEACFKGLFSECTALTVAPEFPAMDLTRECYYGLFFGCTALTNAPALPATNLVDWCYAYLFKNCTALTDAPALPATTLAVDCYSSMFESCTALTDAPALPATQLASGCYVEMFAQCISLTNAPALPATNLADRCYASMFAWCRALVTPPALPATQLTGGCYSFMFEFCSALATTPELPATTLADTCYGRMFAGCTTLTNAPTLPATTLANYCYFNLLTGCENIRISEVETDEYTQPWRIPSAGTATEFMEWNGGMLVGTGGSFKGDPALHTTYYQYAPRVAIPTISPNGGEHQTSVDVSLSTTNLAATIYYTLDGSDPATSGTRQTYTGTPFTLTESATVKAIAVSEGLKNSLVASATFTVIPPAPVLNATIKWRLNRSTGTYFAQLCVTCTAGNFDEISDLRFVFADRAQGGTAYAQLWNSPNRAALAQTMALEGGEMGRYVALDATRITALNAPVVYGLSDGTLAATTSVPATERLIELYVRKRVSPVSGNATQAEVENFVGYLSWVWDGERYWTAVAEGPALMMMSRMQTVTRAPLSLAKLNLSAGLQKAATPDLLAECAITDFTVEGGIVSGRYEVTALQNATQSRVENLGANATVVVYGTASLGGEFKEIGTATVDLNQGAFTVPIETSDCTFFKVVLRIANVVE